MVSALRHQPTRSRRARARGRRGLPPRPKDTCIGGSTVHTVRTILVVEDDLATVEMIRDALAMEGYRVLHAIGDAGRPALVLLDPHMPGMDSAEVARRLRADPATARIPIVGISSNLAREGLPTMPRDDCLPKPFALDDLYAVVAYYNDSCKIGPCSEDAVSY